MKCILLLASIIIAVHGDTVNSKCREYCEKTYALHTTESDGDTVGACTQGCVLSAMLQMNTMQQALPTNADGDTKQSNTAKCVGACDAAFNAQAPLKTACESGCANTPTIEVGQPVEVSMSSRDALFPQAQALMNSAFSSVSNIFNRFFGPQPPAIVAVAPAPHTNRQLLGGDGHDVRNPFAADAAKDNAAALAQMNAKQLLDGDAHDVRNPFAADAAKDNADALAQMTGDKQQPKQLLGGDGHDMFINPFLAINGNNDYDDFSHRFNRMHERMNQLMADLKKSQEDETAGMQPVINVQDPNLNNILNAIFNQPGGNPQMIVEIDTQPMVFEPTINRHKWASFDDGRLDLSNHEPLPPTDQNDIDADENVKRAGSNWFHCLARRAQHLSFVARALVCAALMLCILSLFIVCLQIFTRTRNNRRRAMYMQTMQRGSIPGSPICEKKFSAPPSYYESDAVKVNVDGLQMSMENTTGGAQPLVHQSTTPPPPYVQEEKNETPVFVA